jgi:hypothetical protein
VLGVEQDGSIGPVTIHALDLCTTNVIREFSQRRWTSQARYLRGLRHRLDEPTNTMEEAALRMLA